MGFSLMVASNKLIAPHSHQTLEFAYILSGTMEHQIHGRTDILQAGDYFIVDHGVNHAYRKISSEPLRVLNLLFFPWFISRNLANAHNFADVMNSYLLRYCYKNLQTDPTGMVFHDDTNQVRELLSHIQEEFQKMDWGFLEYIRGAFIDVLILTMRKLENHQSRRADNPLIEQIRTDMEKNYLQEISLAGFAAKHGYSLPYLSRLFHQQMGVSFTQYLQQLRLNYCCHLLETTDKSISQIAQESGYTDQKHFNELFKRHMSLTPREFRAIHRK